MTVQIVERKTRRVVDAEVISGLSREARRALDMRWKSFRRTSRPDFRLPENHGWQWKTKDLGSELSARIMAIRFEGEIQGIMMLDGIPVPSVRPGHSDFKVIYVEYVEAAPWNQRAYMGDERRFDRVGSAMLRIAVQISLEEGHEGRIALHSLPQAEWFYRPSFEDMGIDPDENLRYFELATERVSLFIQGEI